MSQGSGYLRTVNRAVRPPAPVGGGCQSAMAFIRSAILIVAKLEKGVRHGVGQDDLVAVAHGPLQVYERRGRSLRALRARTNQGLTRAGRAPVRGPSCRVAPHLFRILAYRAAPCVSSSRQSSN